MPQLARAELIVLAAPAHDDPYYSDVAQDILDFHAEFVRRARGKDDVVVLTDRSAASRYRDAVGAGHVVVVPMADIWMRDFSSANAADPILFRYTAAGQGGGRSGQRDADSVQQAVKKLAARAGINFRKTQLLNDGGNFVEDSAGNAVVSRKFLRDNGLSEEQGRELLIREAGLSNVAFIDADEQGGLEHADGVVSFVDANTLIVNDYPDDPDYARALRRDLERGLPGVKIHAVIAPHEHERVYDNRFGSACGLYTNALVTPERVYLPQFGIAEDVIALRQVRAVTRREVIPVRSEMVCHMGGGVRCMSWQLRGKHAKQMLQYFSTLKN